MAHILDSDYFSLKIGHLNGHQSYLFSEAYIEFLQFVQYIKSGEPRRPLKVIRLSDLFSNLCELKLCNPTKLEEGLLISEEGSATSKRQLSEETRNAIECLNSFLRDLRKHEVALNAVREKADPSDTEWCSVLATHLFSQLVPEGNVTVSNGMNFQMKECPCGCGKKINVGNTGIGHKLVWHGFPDLMVGQISVVIKSDEDERSDSDDNDSDDGDSDHETINKNSVTAMPFSMQLASQAITNAFAQRKVTNWKGYFYPSIGCSMDKLIVMFYDPDHDILLRRKSPMTLFTQASNIWVETIIELWFILNMHLFELKLEPSVYDHLGISGVKSFLNECNMLRFYEKAVTEACMKDLYKEEQLLNADLPYYALNYFNT